jgi:hypothetical protein
MTDPHKIPRMSGKRRTDRNIPTSILARLVSRSVTGLGPPPQVHQHGNLDLLHVWGETCVRRRFVFKRELDTFCSDLIWGRSSGVHSCVSHSHSPPEGVALCFHTNRENFSSEPDDFSWEPHCGVCFKDLSDCRCANLEPMLHLLWPRGILINVPRLYLACFLLTPLLPFTEPSCPLC